MSEPQNETQKMFLDNLKWYAASCLVTLTLFYALQYFKMDMQNIAFCFQISTGILLGALLQLRLKTIKK
jgi:hypothetical protein